MDAFSKAATTLVTWLTRGDCSKRNTGTFYSMIQSTNSQVRRLIAEKIQYEDELTKFREQTRARLQGIVAQCKSRERRFRSPSEKWRREWSVSWAKLCLQVYSVSVRP